MRPRSIVLVAIAGLAAAMPGQSHAYKLRPELREKMRAASAGERLPVSFVLADRLRGPELAARAHGLDPAARRALVVHALQAHAARVQAPLLAHLRGHQGRGSVDSIESSWLANVVRGRCTRAAIDSAAALDAVEEVWHDAPRARAEVEDGVLVPQGGGSPGDAARLVGADKVWALGFTGQGVVVMNADAGINEQHLALQSQLWSNPGEIPGNGLDDDQNGFADDVHGWDFELNAANLDDGGGHGTATAGCLVADGSCGGVVYGIAPGARVMTGKIQDEMSQWLAIQYALQMGAQCQTSSYSYKNSSPTPPNYRVHRDVADLTLAAGLIRTNSTSNNGAACTLALPIARPFNVSVPGNVPPPYLDPNQTLLGGRSGVLGIGGHRRDLKLDPNSPCGPAAWLLADLLAVLPSYPLANWDPLRHDDYPWASGTQLGLLKPDVCAPLGTLTTGGSGTTCQIVGFSGTSNATPIAMGCLCLWKSANPSLGPEDLAMVVHQSAQDAGSVPGKENDWGAGRIDAYAGLLLSLAVHRVNDEAAFEVVHRSGQPVTLAVDGSTSRPVLIAIGLVRQTVDFGIVKAGIGATLYCAYAGQTDQTGSAQVTLPVPPVGAPATVYTQVFLDDTGGPTGRLLASNVVGVKVVP